MRSFLLALLLCSYVTAASRPNVLFLFTDDQRHDTIRAWGNESIETPNIDRLVKGGLSLRNSYIMGGSSPAVCSPSRACLFSGKTLWNVPCQGEYGFEIPETIKTLPQVFREAGYETFATGKNEPGIAGHFARSFSSADAILFKGMTRSQYSLPLHSFAADGDYLKQKPMKHEGMHSAEVYADAAVQFLQKQKGVQKPFFAYVAFQTPHDPLNVPEDYLARVDEAKVPLFQPFMPQHPFDNGMLTIRDEKLEPLPRVEEKIRKRLAAYYAEVTHTDAQIGRILKALEDAGHKDDTIIVFAADNGLALGAHGLLGKQNVYEHSVRVPLVVAGPGVPAGESRDQLCYLYDIYPTLCDLSGLATPASVEYRSLKPLFGDAKAAHRDHLYFAFMSWQRAVRDNRYKLIEYCVGGQRRSQLFDLQEDPIESRNLIDEPGCARVVADLRQLLQKDRVELKDGSCDSAFARGLGESFWKTYDAVP